MARTGKVITGFSKPKVAKYSETGGVVTYTEGMPFARGVNVEVTPETSDSDDFYADNMAVESGGGRFTSGELKLTVDGLLNEARSLIYGLPAPEEFRMDDNKKVKMYKSNDKANPPYVGVGFIVRYLSDGITTYAPMIVPKVKFNEGPLSAETAEEDISYQTEELTGKISRDDTVEHNWRILFEDQNTEADAEAVLNKYLSIKG